MKRRLDNLRERLNNKRAKLSAEISSHRSGERAEIKAKIEAEMRQLEESKAKLSAFESETEEETKRQREERQQVKLQLSRVNLLERLRYCRMLVTVNVKDTKHLFREHDLRSSELKCGDSHPVVIFDNLRLRVRVGSTGPMGRDVDSTGWEMCEDSEVNVEGPNVVLDEIQNLAGEPLENRHPQECTCDTCEDVFYEAPRLTRGDGFLRFRLQTEISYALNQSALAERAEEAEIEDLDLDHKSRFASGYVHIPVAVLCWNELAEHCQL
jgi:hypothetical protein